MIFPIGDDNIKGGYYPTISYGILLANVLVFVYEFVLVPDQAYAITMTYGAIPAEIMKGEDMHTLFTSMFLHGGIWHLLSNMLFLWIFADNIEAVIGSRRFILFYLLGGLAAHALHIYLYPASTIPTVGASGAIAAVLGAYLVMFPSSRVKLLFIVFPFRVPAFLFLGFWIVNQWISGTSTLSEMNTESAGIAYWAHIGGFVFGVIAGFYYRATGLHEPQHKRRRSEGPVDYWA